MHIVRERNGCNNGKHKKDVREKYPTLKSKIRLKK